MTFVVRVFFVCLGLCLASPATAQGTSWVQIEARPTEPQALERAGAYAARLPDVNGFRLTTGWYAIAIGPYPEAEARARLAELRAAGTIPGDSYVTEGPNFATRFFGLDVALTTPVLPSEPMLLPEPGDETPAEARAAERSLTRAEREEVQTALRAAGVYASVIDADFGPGTRRAMGAWQAANGFEATGILTSRQRAGLVGTYRDALRALGLAPVDDAEAGVSVTLPLNVVTFDRYEPPFAHYQGADGSPRVLLISQTGDRETLSALYDVLETLEIMPVEGPRRFTGSEFTLTGANDRVSSHAYARVTGGAVKGYVLIWPADDGYRRALALDAMQTSFRPSEGVLPDTVGAEQNIDLLAGLQIRRPERAVSGFFVSSDGGILTSASQVESCGRLETGGDVSVRVAATDTAGDLALLRPEVALSPLAFARLTETEPRLQSDIAVAGFSFGGVLTLPSVTFGTLADVEGLDGDEGVHRLALSSEAGDVGGPVFDAFGAVAGMLLPDDDGARVLPGDVSFARDADALSAFLTANGIAPARTTSEEPMAPEDLTTLAADMTVLVTCWN